MKFGIRSTSIAIAMVVLLAGCRKDDFEEIRTICPEVVSTSPARNATNVSVITTVSATFNTTMDASTFNAETFSLKRGGTSVPGSISVSGRTASFTSTFALDGNATYTVTIKNGVKEVMGNPLQQDYVWTFSTGPTLQPVIVATAPASDATGIPVNTNVTATFNVAMDGNTINTSTFTLHQGSTPVASAVSYSGNTATLDPNANLLPNTTYTARMSAIIRDMNGNSMQGDFVWIFSTGATLAPAIVGTSPANDETSVVLNKEIRATFNMSMDPSTINSTTFLLRRGVLPVTGTVTYANKTATFTPTVSLAPDVVYTATLTTGMEEIGGMPLADDYVWTFTTGTFSAPTVISTNPTDNATFVSSSTVLTVTFSEPMDPNTIHATSFTLTKGAISYPGRISYSGNTATFAPKNSLPDGYYTAVISTHVKNLAGIPLDRNHEWSFTTSGNIGAPRVNLNSVMRFGIFATTGIQNVQGQSLVHNMDVGIFANRSLITGFPPAVVDGGIIYALNDATPAGVAAMLGQARQDLIRAYDFAEEAFSPAPILVAGDIGGATLTPGIYRSNASLLLLSDQLTLDAQGDADAVWIFQIDSDLITGDNPNCNVNLIGGAKAQNVYWQVGGTATIGMDSYFRGNIMAWSDITMKERSKADGRLLSINGAVSLQNTNTIHKP